MAYNERTSRRMASLAAKILRNPTSSEDARSLAASVLTRALDHQPPQNAMRQFRRMAEALRPRHNLMQVAQSYAKEHD